jgi:diguanylate cyclase (GGDEF)-like protein
VIDRATQPNESPAHRWALIGAQLMGLWIAVTAVAIGVRYLHGVSPRWGNYATDLGLIAAMVGGFFSFRHRQNRDWQEPMARLQERVSEVRAGQASIDSLNGVGGQIAPATAVIQELLRELRTQETRIAELRDELRQRLAQRTEVLERRIGSLKRQSTTDTLTGLQNRRRFDEMLPEAVVRCQETGEDLCVLMIDVDYFKQLNDLKGHATGDEFLKSIGQLIRSSIRPDDEAFRIGGDEFVIVLPGVDGDIARTKAASLATLADRLAKTFKVPLSPRLSIGISSLRECRTDSPEALLAAADKHLYEIKSSRTVKSRAG